MKTAIVFDWTNQVGGAERVLTGLNKIFPEAPLYTSVLDLKKADWAKNFPEIKTAFLQKIPGGKKYYYFYYPLIPLAFEQFNFDSFDLVISLTSGPAKAIITKPQTCHICYCLTPPRYFWEKKFQFLPPSFLDKFKRADYLFSKRPDYFLTISKNSARRIKKFYQTKAEVIYPGIDLKKFKPARKKSKSEPYFLIVSRLVEYKKTDLAVKAFNQLGWQLKIIGRGRQMKKLKIMAKKNIQFLGQVKDQELIKNYQNCRALILPQEEDFGLTPIEAQACGKPVIAFARGGALETIVPGKTGEFFHSQTGDSLVKALKIFDPEKYSPEACLKKAQDFSLKSFMLSFKRKAEKLYNQYQK